MKNKTWSGRFKKQINEDVLDFSQSLTIDIVLYEVDILVTEAHVEMLSKCGHITQKELKKIYHIILLYKLKKIKKLFQMIMIQYL